MKNLENRTTKRNLKLLGKTVRTLYHNIFSDFSVTYRDNQAFGNDKKTHLGAATEAHFSPSNTSISLTAPKTVNVIMQKEHKGNVIIIKGIDQEGREYDIRIWTPYNNINLFKLKKNDDSYKIPYNKGIECVPDEKDITEK